LGVDFLSPVDDVGYRDFALYRTALARREPSDRVVVTGSSGKKRPEFRERWDPRDVDVTTLPEVAPWSEELRAESA